VLQVQNFWCDLEIFANEKHQQLVRNINAHLDRLARDIEDVVRYSHPRIVYACQALIACIPAEPHLEIGIIFLPEECKTAWNSSLKFASFSFLMSECYCIGWKEPGSEAGAC
jgi:hypothetical protein